MREWVEYVDWAYFTEDALTPDDVQTAIDQLRAAATLFEDSVPPLESPLETPCDF